MKKGEKEGLARLPKVDRVLAREELGPWRGTGAATGAVRAVIERARLEMIQESSVFSTPYSESQMAMAARLALNRLLGPKLRPVFNATGVIIHTNLGRAPLSEEAIEAVTRTARGYSTLEYELEGGRRGSRHDLVHNLLIALTEAEDAVVVNNNAAALLLILTTVAKRHEVLVSRGQLVEIGGSFRIPDICRVSGARLVEVGTTNRTRIGDYRAAITPRTAMILRVHPSNFRVIGFTEETSLAELVELGREHGIPVADDLGSGALVELDRMSPLPREPLVRESVTAGADVVTFSGDKLLGGPQAGIAVGKAEFIQKLRKHPLMRALRPDKMTFAALDATLRSYLEGRQAELPVLRMIAATTVEVEGWLRSLLAAGVDDAVHSAGLTAEILPSESWSGGGSLPQETLPSRALAVSGPQRRLVALQSALRLGNPPVIGYLTDGRLLLDGRTLLLESTADVAAPVVAALETLK